MYSVSASCVVHDWKGILFVAPLAVEMSALSREEVKLERREFVSSESERPGRLIMEPSPVIMFLPWKDSRLVVVVLELLVYASAWRGIGQGISLTMSRGPASCSAPPVEAAVTDRCYVIL
jgi:hypothetical protein